MYRFKFFVLIKDHAFYDINNIKNNNNNNTISYNNK